MSNITDEQIADHYRDRSIACVDKHGNVINRGDKVRVFKGTELRSTGKKKTFVCGRTYVITVHGADRGYEGHSALSGEEGAYAHDPAVVWPGTGGYWTRCDSRLVELVKE